MQNMEERKTLIYAHMCNCTCSQWPNYEKDINLQAHMCSRTCSQLPNYNIEESPIKGVYMTCTLMQHYRSPIKADGFEVKIISQTRSTNSSNFMSQFSWTTNHNSNIFAFTCKQNFCKINKLYISLSH